MQPFFVIMLIDPCMNEINYLSVFYFLSFLNTICLIYKLFYTD